MTPERFELSTYRLEVSSSSHLYLVTANGGSSFWIVRPSLRSAGLLLGQIIHSDAINRGCGVVLGHPLRDLRGRVGTSHLMVTHLTGYVVMNLLILHVLLELFQAGVGVGTIEPANGHDRLLKSQLIARRLLGYRGGSSPAIGIG